MADYDDVEPSKTLGGLTYQLRELGDGPHLQVAVRGHGEQGQRPLLGVLTMLREEWVQFAETGDADQVSAAVRAIHYPAYNEQNRDRGTLVPICPDCGGKAGVHPCGCWAGRDERSSARSASAWRAPPGSRSRTPARPSRRCHDGAHPGLGPALR